MRHGACVFLIWNVVFLELASKHLQAGRTLVIKGLILGSMRGFVNASWPRYNPAMARIFVPPESWWNDTALQLTAEQVRHLSQSLRLRKGDALDIVSGNHLFSCTLHNLTDRRLEVVKISAVPATPFRPQITLVQCLPKQDKLTEILRACTEMGVTDFIPVVSARSVPVPHQPENKAARWTTVIESAAEQSRQPLLPLLHAITSLSDIATHPRVASADVRLVPWEEEKETSLKSVLATYPLAETLALVIGPEGGLAADEIAFLKSTGFHAVSLGPTILRVEHAGLAAISQIRYHYTPC
jgi:16S rRNA (uracil1498-N3)-methyltransferase